MKNFETMKALQWKIDQVHAKSSPKLFLQHIRGGNTSTAKNNKTSFLYICDIILYVIFLAIVIAFVYIVMSFAKDFKP